VLNIDQRALLLCAGAVSCGWGLSRFGHIFTISWQRVIGRQHVELLGSVR